MPDQPPGHARLCRCDLPGCHDTPTGQGRRDAHTAIDRNCADIHSRPGAEERQALRDDLAGLTGLTQPSAHVWFLITTAGTALTGPDPIECPAGVSALHSAALQADRTVTPPRVSLARFRARVGDVETATAADTLDRILPITTATLGLRQ